MDLIDQSNKLIKVRIEELESKIRSKKDLYYILRQWCKFAFYIFRSILYPRRKPVINSFPQRCSFWKEKSNYQIYLNRHAK